MNSEDAQTDSLETSPCSPGTPGPSRASTAIAISRQLISLAAPILGSNILGVLDGSVNAMWVGRFLGDTALAAASNADTVLLFLFALALGIWTALTVQAGFYLGTNSREDARRLIKAACAVFAVLGLSIAAAGEVLSYRLLRALEVPPESFQQAEQYLRWILICIPITYFYGMIGAILQGAGDTKTTFYFSLISIGLDAGLNPILIFGFGPVPRMGIRGAALATVLSQGIGLIALVVFLFRRGYFSPLPTDRFVMGRAEWNMAGELLRRGVPIGIEYLGESLLAILMISLVNRFGSDVTAAFGAANQMWNCVMMPSISVSLAATSMAANSLGANDWARVRVITRMGVTFSLFLSITLLFLLEALNSRAFALFLPAHSPALGIASEINRVASWSCVAFAGCGALMGTPRAAGAVWGPLTLSASAIVTRVVLAEELLRHWQAQGIWWSFPISGVIVSIATLLYYQRGRWRSVPLRAKTKIRHRDEALFS